MSNRRVYKGILVIHNMKATERQKEQMKEYAKLPEVKAKRKIYMKEYSKKYRDENCEKVKEKNRIYYIKNKDKIDDRNKKWIKENKERWDKYRNVYYYLNRDKLLQYSRDWYHDLDKSEYNRKKRIWQNNKRKTDLNFAAKKRLRCRVISAFRKYSETGKIRESKDYGINYGKIIKKLISELPKDFDTVNYEIDHIKPCCAFDLTDPAQVRECFDAENHQWLTAKENKKKITSDMKQMVIKRGRWKSIGKNMLQI